MKEPSLASVNLILLFRLRLSVQELFAGIQPGGAGAWYPAVAGHRLRGEERES